MAGCGTCTLCCKIMEIPELGKPHCQWCTNCHKSVGCKIYETRPNSCREFRCVWLQSQSWPKPWGEELRPNRTKVVLCAMSDGKGVVAQVDPAFPGAYRH